MFTSEQENPRNAPENENIRLTGQLGPGAIVFMVIAAAAPLAVVGGVFPTGALTGNGAGMPSAFLLDGIILLFFAVGLATMSRHVKRTGGFFTYVGYGLGRPSGVAAAWLALLTYATAMVAVFAYLGLSLGEWIDTHTGLDLPWWVWTLGAVGVVGVLGYRKVELSSKVLAVVLIVEIGAVLVLAAVIVARGGADGLSLNSFHPSEFMSGNPALALMWGMAGYAGFESTTIYRAEARDPEKTIPRATYGALVLVALFYTFASWALVQGWGESFDSTVENTTSNFVLATTQEYLGSVGGEIVNVLLLTSFFACALSFHNVIARYKHVMANAGILPRRIGRVHDRHHSPYVSSLVLTTAVVSLFVLFALLDLDPYLEVYTWFGGIGTVSVVVLMALTCLAVLVYLSRKNVPGDLWRNRIAPTIGLVGLSFIAIMLLMNFPTLLGDVDSEGNAKVGVLSIGIYAMMAAVPVFGLLQAYWLMRKRPAVYRTVIDSISD
jgi:amino acid transporter